MYDTVGLGLEVVSVVDELGGMVKGVSQGICRGGGGRRGGAARLRWFGGRGAQGV